jgi:FHA domain
MTKPSLAIVLALNLLNPWIIIGALIVLAILLVVVSFYLFRGGKKKGAKGTPAAAPGNWQSQSQPGQQPPAWGQQPGQQPPAWGQQPGQQAPGWDQQQAQQPGAWGQQPAQAPGAWGQQPGQQAPGWDQQQAQQPGAWGQQPAQAPGWDQQQAQAPGAWGQQPAQAPGWGQQPAQPAAQQDPWGQQNAAQGWSNQAGVTGQPQNSYPGVANQSWGQQPAAQQDAWGQQPAAQQDAWGQQPQQPYQAAGAASAPGWQQPQNNQWGGQQDATAFGGESDKTMLRAPGSAPQTGLGFVRVEEGKEPGRVFEIRKESLSIGRSRESDIFLEDLAVSRLHATILNLGNGNYALKDEGSANGTKVNGQLVNKYQTYPLQEGDRVQLGQTVLAFARR